MDNCEGQDAEEHLADVDLDIAEIFKELCDIVDEWIEIYNKDGRPLPPPTAKKYSGKFVLRTGPAAPPFQAMIVPIPPFSIDPPGPENGGQFT